MKQFFLTLNHSFLFLCASMYLGTGGSLVFFSFPQADQFTVDNYYLQFVPQVAAATEFFRTMTIWMLIAGGIMLVAEWKRGLRWVPIVVLLAVGASTVLTIYGIFPYNEEMAAGITNEARLHEVLAQWMDLNRIRVSLWAVEWGAMMCFFGRAFFKLGKAL